MSETDETAAVGKPAALALLPDGVRRLLARLALFEHGFPPAAVTAMLVDEAQIERCESCGAAHRLAEEPGDGVQPPELLALLAAGAIVPVEAKSGEAWFAVPEPLRTAALEELNERADLAAARTRHTEFWIGFVAAAVHRFGGPERAAALHRLDARHAGLLALFDRLLDEGRGPEALRLGDALAPYWEPRGLLTAGRARLERALCLAHDLSPELRRRGLMAAGRLAYRLGDSRAAWTYGEAALCCSADAGDARSAIFLALSNAALDEGELRLAIGLLEAALEAVPAQAPRIRASVLNNLAAVLRRLPPSEQTASDRERAAVCNEQALAIARAEGASGHEASALRGLGYAAWWLGDRGRAADLIGQALAIYREQEIKASIAGTLHDLGSLARQQGDRDRAVALLDESAALYQETGNARATAHVLSVLGDVYADRGEHARAFTCYAEARERYQAAGDEARATVQRKAMAAAALRSGDIDGARRHGTIAAERAKALGDAPTEALAREFLARALLRGRERARAEAEFAAALAIWRERGDTRNAGRVLHDLGSIADARSETALRRERLEEAAALRREAGDRDGLAASLDLLSALAQVEGDLPRAVALAEEELAQVRGGSNRAAISVAFNRLCQALRAQGFPTGSEPRFEQALQFWRMTGERRNVLYALAHLGTMAERRGDEALARWRFEEAAGLSRSPEDNDYLVPLCADLGRLARKRGDLVAATSWYERQLAALPGVGYADKRVGCLSALGETLAERGEHAASAARWAEALDLARAYTLTASVPVALAWLGHEQARMRQFDSAIQHLSEALALLEQPGADQKLLAWTLHRLGWLAEQRDETALARGYFARALRLRQAQDDRPNMARCLAGLAAVRCAEGEIEAGLRLLAASEALREAAAARLGEEDRLSQEGTVRRARAVLSDEAYAVAWTEGWMLPPEAAIRRALASAPIEPAGAAWPDHEPPGG